MKIYSNRPWYEEYRPWFFLIIIALVGVRVWTVDMNSHNRPLTNSEREALIAKTREEDVDKHKLERAAAINPLPPSRRMIPNMIYLEVRPGAILRMVQDSPFDRTASAKLRARLNESCFAVTPNADPKHCRYTIQVSADVMHFLSCPAVTETIEGMKFSKWKDALNLTCQPLAACKNLDGNIQLGLQTSTEHQMVIAQLKELVSRSVDCDPSQAFVKVREEYVVSSLGK